MSGMGKLSVTYITSSMEDLAQGLEERAAELEHQIGSSNQTKAKLLRAEADGYRGAADIVRKTRIEPDNAAFDQEAADEEAAQLENNG